MMAHYVAKELNLRPLDILESWSLSELCVAYGHYANQVARQQFDMWRKQDPKTRGVQPIKYAVKFVE